MQKKLIALAVAGALVAPGAMAGVEVYGKARVSVDFNDNGDTTAGNESSAISVTSHGSRLGFKGSEDLGSGLTAVWQYEREVNWDAGGKTDDSDPNFSARNTFVGLAGGFGTVLLGTHDTPYKMATKKIDVFSDTAADYNAVVQHDTRADNVIAYVAPDMGAFSFVGAYVPNYADDDLAMTEAEAETDAISLMGAYKANGLTASLAYESLGTATDDAESTKVSVGYVMDKTTLGFIYQMNEMGNALDQDVIYFSVKHKMGDLTLKGALGSLGEETSGSDDGSTMVALGVSKSYTKNTELYALYASMSNDDGAHNGLKKVKGVVDGETVSTLSIGINTKFSSM